MAAAAPPAASSGAGAHLYREYALDELGTDSANPTPYFTGVGVNYLGAGGRCVEGGISYRPHGSVFSITATAADAPESCGSFYWDPLLQAVPGDGFAWELATDSGHGTTVDSAAATTPSFVAPIAIALMIVAPLRRG